MHSYTLRRFIQRKTIAAWAISMSVLIFIFAALSPLAHAQCFFDDIQTYTCSDDAGTITLVGTGGSNIFRFLNGVIGQITVVSGGGSDTVDFLSYTTGVIVNLSSTSPQTVAGGLTILFSGFNTAGQSYTVNGGAGNDIIHGGFGTDTINGNAGNDSLSGGWFDNPSGYQNDNSGNDTIYGGDGNDFIFGGHGNDTLYGDAGDDDLHGFDGVDVVSGGDGNDILHGNNGVDIVMGGPGDDVLTGGVEIDTLDGGDGTDTISDTYDGCLGDIQISIENHQVCEPPEPPEPPTPPTPDPAAPTLLTPDLCITERTRVALVDGTLLVFSDFTNTANGMSISHIPLRSLRALSDEEKASGIPVPLLYKDSEFAPGWSVGLYWQNSHYGFVIYKDSGKTIYDDTDAICGWF